LDSFDIVEGLVIKDGPQVEVLNGVSLHGGLVVSWPVGVPVTAALTVTSLTEHWREAGLPGYAQFDNDMIFHGTHRYPDALGRVIRLCLSLSVVPVFVPPRETGSTRQGMLGRVSPAGQGVIVALSGNMTSRLGSVKSQGRRCVRIPITTRTVRPRGIRRWRSSSRVSGTASARCG